MKLDLSRSVRVLAVGLLTLVRITAGSILGAAVNIELLDKDRSRPVRAHYSVVSSLPCPALAQLCSGDCVDKHSSSRLTGALPSPGWCLHQWQKNISEQHTSALQLGSDRAVLLQSRADLSVRADTHRVNQPPYVALPPPVRLQAACPQDIPVNVMDLDGDEIRCRYEKTDLGELLQLNEETCTLLYKGGAGLGQYSVLIMVEDFPSSDHEPFSTVPVHLLITVESGAGCSVVPEFTGVSPEGGAVIHILPFEEVHVNITVDSRVQSVSELAVTGPPGLFISPMEIGQNFQSSVMLSWVRGPNQFAHLLSVCFTANTQSLQSNIRCIWLQQTQTDPLPPGTELKCKERELQMSLVLPVSFLEDLHFPDLQLNDPSCPVFYNSTHVTAIFSLTGCGTKRMHLGSELLYTNTLRSINPNSTISRVATLVLPLACRIPAQHAKGPAFKIAIPEEVKTFGAVSFWLEFHLPGKGPLAKDTLQPRLRSLPQVRVARERRATDPIEMLDLHVFSNCSLARAELMVGRCVESETKDFTNSRPLLNQGCVFGNGTLEILTSTSTVRIFRLYLGSLGIKGDTMYVECVVHLCVTTKQTDRCTDPCMGTPDPTIVDSILTRSYTVRSGPVSLIKATDTSTTTATPQSATPVAQPSTSQISAAASRPLDTGAFWVVAVSLLVLMLLP